MAKIRFLFVVIMGFGLALVPLSAENADSRMSFFIASSGAGNGADLGGMEGADQRCALLARAVGGGDKTWHAYLSTTSVNARDRIGSGPWFNSKGIQIAENVDDLHSDNNKLTKSTQLNEFGVMVNGRGDSPNRHDLLTGSQLDGTRFLGSEDKTCSDWTSHGEGSAQVGHHDRTGGGQNPTSWNSAHGSRGCGQADLQGTGGDALFYCFAID